MKCRDLAVALLVLAAPLTATAAQGGGSEQGAQVYSKHCAMCHGDKGEGAKLGPALTKETDAAAVAKVVRSGEKKMPGFEGKISDAEIQAVSQYVTKQLAGGGS